MPEAIFFNIPSSGHIYPTLPVMELLSQTDLDIVYVNQKTERAKVEKTGVRFVAYPDYEIFDGFFANPSTNNFPGNALKLLRFAAEVLPFTLELIEQEQPDFIIFDSLASWGKMAGRITGLSTVAFITTFILDLSNPPPIPLKTRMMMFPQLLAAMPGYLTTMGGLWGRYRKTPITFLDALMATGDLNIVFTSVEMQPDSEKFKDMAEFVGAAVGKRTDGGDFPFDELRDGVPKVYISLGTIAKNEAFLRRCFTAFGDMDAQFILSAGRQTDLAALGTIPENFVVRNFVPQLDVLDKADVFITHSGMNSVHEGLLAGVPLIAVPQQPEQAIVAAQIVATGAGLGLQMMPPFGDVSAEQLRTALHDILSSPAYKDRAMQLGDGLRAAGGAPRVVELLRGFAEKRI